MSIVALCLYYLAMSFQTTLPWGVCDPAWGENCLPSDPALAELLPIGPDRPNVSSAELYFMYVCLLLSIYIIVHIAYIIVILRIISDIGAAILYSDRTEIADIVRGAKCRFWLVDSVGPRSDIIAIVMRFC